MDIDNLVAIDVHTHVHRSVNAPKANPEDNEHLAAMAAYFKTAAASFTVDDLAAYYRERKMAAVTFTIDRRTRRRTRPARPRWRSSSGPATTTPTSSSRSAPSTRPAAPRRSRMAKRQIEARRQGLQVPPEQPGVHAQRPLGLPGLRGHPGGRAARALPHRPDRRGRGHPRRRRHPARVLQPDAPGRRGRRLPRHADHPRPPELPVAGGGAVGRHPQAPGLHRPVRLVAEVLPADPHPVREHAAQAQDALRHGLPGAHPGALDGRPGEDRRSATRSSPASSRTTRPSSSAWPSSPAAAR